MSHALDVLRKEAQTVGVARERPSRAEAEQAVATLLDWIGDDPEREGLIDTPARVVKALEEMYSGYHENATTTLGRTFEDVGGYADMVTMRDISFFSHCEHHMVPIIGKVHVAYVPDGQVLGLSKIARLVEMFARRLQTQEKLTAQIADALQDGFAPKGVAVRIEAEHMCMAMRGIRKTGSTTVTSMFTGTFQNDRDLQLRFSELLISGG